MRALRKNGSEVDLSNRLKKVFLFISVCQYVEWGHHYYMPLKSSNKFNDKIFDPYLKQIFANIQFPCKYELLSHLKNLFIQNCGDPFSEL